MNDSFVNRRRCPKALMDALTSDPPASKASFVYSNKKTMKRLVYNNDLFFYSLLREGILVLSIRL